MNYRDRIDEAVKAEMRRRAAEQEAAAVLRMQQLLGGMVWGLGQLYICIIAAGAGHILRDNWVDQDEDRIARLKALGEWCEEWDRQDDA